MVATIRCYPCRLILTSTFYGKVDFMGKPLSFLEKDRNLWEGGLLWLCLAPHQQSLKVKNKDCAPDPPHRLLITGFALLGNPS